MVRISDEEIVRELLKDGRIKYTELAEKFGITETAVRKRIKRLRDEGIIERFTVSVNPRKLGYRVHALIGLDTKPEELVHVIRKLKEDKRIISLYTSSGDHMIMMETWLKDYPEMLSFVKHLEGMKGVTRVCPAVMLEKIV